MKALEQKISSGKIRPGDKLPSENVLSKEFEISRQTVRKALEILENKGLIIAKHGIGTFCAEPSRGKVPTKNIGVVTTYLSDYIFPRVIQGIDTVLNKQGYSILLKNTNNSRQAEASCLEELIKKNIDGLIIEPSKTQIFCRHIKLYEQLEESRIPYVFIQGCFSQMSDKPKVLMDDCKGGYLVTKHLISLGHKTIVGVFKADDMQGQKRHKGYVMALQEANIAYDPDKVVWFYTEDRMIHPYHQMKQMSQRYEQEPFDAVVCYNDQIAMAVIHALEEKGISVPKQVAVTGYDNSELGSSLRIPLTTIAHPQNKLGEMAAELLLKLINKELKVGDAGTTILIEPELVIRESSQSESISN
ncbi:MAG: GntR family transcriptional regulator [bacterium]|nr:GntR family transcriptional regulator [bacterium]